MFIRRNFFTTRILPAIVAALSLAATPAFSLASALTPPAPAQSNGPLTDQDVLQMVKAGFDDSTILRFIQASDVDFDLSISAMVSLKNAGVSQSLIQSMLSIEVAKKAVGVDAALAAISATASENKDELHVFALVNGRLIPTEPETVKWRSSGGLRGVSMLGIERGPMLGTIVGPHSDLVTRWPPLNMVPLDISFYILAPKGTSASDFQLLHLAERSDHREFRTISGDRAHAWATPENTVAFTLEAIAPRVYKITLPNLNVGEYGLLTPLVQVNSDSPAEGRIYTFRLVE